MQLVERWILAKLRHWTFFSLAELNHCIRTLLTELNEKPFKQWPGNRREWFERLDRPALAPLPKHAYQYVAIKTAKVNIDYHVQYDQHLYSVPHHCVGEPVEIHAGERLVEVYFHNQRIASHVRQHHPGTTTEPAHMPEKHAKHQQWTPGRLMNWAQSLGPGGAVVGEDAAKPQAASGTGLSRLPGLIESAAQLPGRTLEPGLYDR